MPTSDAKPPLKPLFWIGASRKDYAAFPDAIQDDVGYVLYWAQLGRKHDDAKPLKGFGDAGVLEVVASHDGGAFRTVYSVRFAKAVYVLHAFQKKSKAGVATPPQEIELVRKRLKAAKEHHEQFTEGK
ncbi:MAG: type II toxin-antitoxin system RelE/ParE family toxin [Alphaproteobacteria bacterium]|nr:type II toxin-antitoxin system RelE/ParE family toxin [Alphaproteobacteria bacterium]